jgi:hypothetical protein
MLRKPGARGHLDLSHFGTLRVEVLKLSAQFEALTRICCV